MNFRLAILVLMFLIVKSTPVFAQTSAPADPAPVVASPSPTAAPVAVVVPAESIISAPLADAVTKQVAGAETSRGSPLGDYDVVTRDDTSDVTAFDFMNIGPNRVVPVAQKDIGVGPARMYNFVFPDRARQDIHLEVTDIPNDTLSQNMESYIYFFPRVNVPAISWPTATSPNQAVVVTLPTGEVVNFDPSTKMMSGGVMSELTPLDLSPVVANRKFAQFAYTGTGVTLKVDARGRDPRLNNIATLQKGSQTCKIPTKLLFDQDPSSDVQFLFAKDEDFNAFLLKQCHMSFLP